MAFNEDVISYVITVKNGKAPHFTIILTFFNG